MQLNSLFYDFFSLYEQMSVDVDLKEPVISFWNNK